MENLVATIVYYICLAYFCIGGLGAVLGLCVLIYACFASGLKRLLPMVLVPATIYSFIGLILWKIMEVCQAHM